MLMTGFNRLLRSRKHILNFNTGEFAIKHLTNTLHTLDNENF